MRGWLRRRLRSWAAWTSWSQMPGSLSPSTSWIVRFHLFFVPKPGLTISFAVDIEKFDKVIAVNLRGVMLCYKHAAKQMVAQKRGGRLLGTRLSNRLVKKLTSVVQPRLQYSERRVPNTSKPTQRPSSPSGASLRVLVSNNVTWLRT